MEKKSINEEWTKLVDNFGKVLEIRKRSPGNLILYQEINELEFIEFLKTKKAIVSKGFLSLEEEDDNTAEFLFLELKGCNNSLKRIIERQRTKGKQKTNLTGKRGLKILEIVFQSLLDILPEDISKLLNAPLTIAKEIIKIANT